MKLDLYREFMKLHFVNSLPCGKLPITWNYDSRPPDLCGASTFAVFSSVIVAPQITPPVSLHVKPYL